MPTKEDVCIVALLQNKDTAVLFSKLNDMTTLTLLRSGSGAGRAWLWRCPQATGAGPASASVLQFALAPLLQVGHLLQDQSHAVSKLLELGYGDFKAVR